MILAYKGTSWISRYIKFCTLGRYSHVAWLKTTPTLRNMIRNASKTELGAQLVEKTIIRAGCIEAWHKDGVAERSSLTEGHKSGTVIDVYDLPGFEWWYQVTDWMRSQVGKEYWLKGVLLARLNRHFEIEPPVDESGAISKYFCSHLIETGLRLYGYPTVDTDVPPWGVWPDSMPRAVSTVTKYLLTIKLP